MVEIEAKATCNINGSLVLHLERKKTIITIFGVHLHLFDLAALSVLSAQLLCVYVCVVAAANEKRFIN